MNKYEDIINLPRHISKKRRLMDIGQRAAQFAPFAALTGHHSAIREGERLTESKIELDDYMKAEIDKKIEKLVAEKNPDREIQITYFQKDKKKEGGLYISEKLKLKKIDKYQKILLLEGDKKIKIEDIIRIEG